MKLRARVVAWWIQRHTCQHCGSTARYFFRVGRVGLKFGLPKVTWLCDDHGDYAVRQLHHAGLAVERRVRRRHGARVLGR